MNTINFKSPSRGQYTLVQDIGLLKAVVNSTTDGIWVCDADARILLINPAAERVNNIQQEDVIGMSMYDLVDDGFIDKSAVIEVIEKQKPMSVIQNRQGKKLISTGTPVFDENGELKTVVVSTQDITEVDALREKLHHQEAINENYRVQLFELQDGVLDTLDFIAKSENYLTSVNKAIKASRSESTVMLYGESGTGKGIIAKMIHKNSARSDGPFISINCGAIPHSLIESELFGYQKGAFTGASVAKPGLIEIANGGILFLDEVAELPMSAQVKLLKFIEDGMITRLGDTKARKIDIKIVAATHRNLKKMTKEKSFREDLFYRLNVIPITIPPLRERKDCLEPLLTYYIRKISKEHEVKKRLSQEAMDALLSFKFPGNVRQLINICERLVVLTDGVIIGFDDLPREVSASTINVKSTLYKGGLKETTTLKSAIEELEKTLLMQASRECKTQQKISNRLGISQASVARKIKKYGLKSVLE